MALVNCPDCGRPVSDASPSCPHCGRPNPAGGQPWDATRPAHGPRPQVSNHLVPAILVTLCCCLPAGIPAIVYAAQVDSKLSAGDYEGARRASEQAQKWAWISFGLGLAAGVFYLVLGLAGAFSEG